MSSTTLLGFYESLESMRKFLLEEETSFNAETNEFVHDLSSLVSDSDEYLLEHRTYLLQADLHLNKAYQLLARGDNAEAETYLRIADRMIVSAMSAWLLATEVLGDGAEDVAEGLRKVRNTSALTVMGGATYLAFTAATTLAGTVAVSALAHAGFISTLLALSEQRYPVKEQELSEEVSANSKMPEPTKAEKPKRTEPAECSPVDNKDRKAVDYNGASCRRPEADSAAVELEKRIAVTIREKKIDPKTVTKDTKALIAEATQALIEWRDDKTVLHKSGIFFLQTEAPEKMDQSDLVHLSELQEQWTKNAIDYKSAVESASEGDGQKAVMDRLFDDYLTLYIRNNANLSDFLDGRGGNCEAQTKLILAAMAEGGVTFPPNKHLAVQIFNDNINGHIQAVVYDTETKTVHNLLTGETTTEIRAPIFDQHIFYHAYLESKGESPPVTVEKLLIVDADERSVAEGSSPSYSTNTKLNLASYGKGTFSNGPIPEVAYIHRPDRQNNIADAGSDGRSGVGGYRHEVKNLDELSDDKKWILHHFNGGTPIHLDFNMTDNYDLIFRTNEQKEYFNSLSSPEEKQRFLLTLTNRTIAERLSDHCIAESLEVLSNPMLLMKQKNGEISKTVEILKELQEIVSRCGYTIAHYCPLPETNGVWEAERDTSHALTKASIEEMNPMIRTLDEKERRFLERVKKHPLEFILLMDMLSTDQREDFIYLIRYISYENIDGGAFLAIQKMLANRNMIGVGNQAGYEPKRVIHFTLVDDNDHPSYDPAKDIPEGSKPALKNEDGQKGERKKDRSADDSSAPYRVSAEAMIDFALHYEAKRWTPALAKKFQELNRDGQYDKVFLDKYNLLDQTYPKAQRNMEDPYYMLKNRGESGAKISRDTYLILQEILKRRDDS